MDFSRGEGLPSSVLKMGECLSGADYTLAREK